MNTKQIDNLNVLLLIISLIVAVLIPFKLFLFSYAVLGPLHYLTEINWLKQKNYFLQSQKKWSAVFIAFAILISTAPTLTFFADRKWVSFETGIKTLESLSPIILISSLLFSISLLIVRKTKFIGSALILSIAIALIANQYSSEASFLFGLFLPTLIHVYIFTFFFILYGAFKSKSKTGLYLSILLLAIPLIITFIPIELIKHNPSKKVQEVFISSNMLYISSALANLISNIETKLFNPLSEIGIRIHIFIAFAYTYHYLNWFSKTSIIGWKNAITKKKGVLIGIMWASSVTLYFYNFKIGFVTLFFLSYLHVFLELPLNSLTIKETFNIKRN